VPGAIEHGVHQHGGDLATLSRQSRELVAGNGEDFDWFEDDDISGRSDEPGIRQHTGNIACMPLKEFGRSGATIDEHSEPAGEDNVETLNLAALSAYDFAGTQLADGPVGGQPLQLGAGRGAEASMFGQPIDEILCDHRRVTSADGQIMP